jgi:hypothetical protein
MALIDDVKAVCDRLVPLGWRDRLLIVTSNQLDIAQSTNSKLKNRADGGASRHRSNPAGLRGFSFHGEPSHYWRKPRAQSVVPRAGQFLGPSHCGRCSFSESKALPDARGT